MCLGERIELYILSGALVASVNKAAATKAAIVTGSRGMKFSALKGIFAQEQTSRGLLVVGLDAEGRQVEVLFHMTNEPKANWEAVKVSYL
ncbi:hypothetical protein H6F86_10155 [Phormidium sp. FACHB-592]|uniref:Uncharacterized protein n=1 Tax=Stenomitos frigidus AS-A4 TaxID=2933935 RepID=A0ABV0KPS3_9CYAN|nr:hypothetical protein [Phormidium sp. FACHB-592]MBD2074245.1 hypothetical protein [Phormidium sp. FACHB-592]